MPERQSTEERTRRLYWHGMALLLLGLLMGAAVQAVANPRIGLSAHTGTLMNGILLIAMGALWPRLSLSARAESAAFSLNIAGSWLNCVALFFAGVFGTSRSTPLHGAGYAGTPLQEMLVGAGLIAGAVALLVGSAIVLWGLRGRGVSTPAGHSRP
jgi:hydroxylaminobenzene mutase